MSLMMMATRSSAAAAAPAVPADDASSHFTREEDTSKPLGGPRAYTAAGTPSSSAVADGDDKRQVSHPPSSICTIRIIFVTLCIVQVVLPVVLVWVSLKGNIAA
jgi:hypothetical protein